MIIRAARGPPPLLYPAITFQIIREPIHNTTAAREWNGLRGPRVKGVNADV